MEVLERNTKINRSKVTPCLSLLTSVGAGENERKREMT